VGFLPVRSGEIQIAPEQKDIASLDQRAIWWGRYAAAVGAPSPPPNFLSAPKLAELTREPLLCYLLALSGYDAEGAQLAAGNLNLIYRELIDEVWRRGWGEGQGNERRAGAGRFLNQENFNRLMETIALAGWQGGDTRVCSQSSFLNATKALRTKTAWDDFVRDNGDDITNLAMNFYLKSAEIETRGFEFTHKSFGDYLAGRAILRVAFDLISLVDRRIEHAMKEWFDVTSAGNLTNELLDHMRRELLLLAGSSDGLKDVEGLKSAFERLASAVIRDGLPANGNADQSWRAAETRQRNAEVMIWAVLNACSLAAAEAKSGRAQIEVAWPNKTDFGNLLRRVVGQSDLGVIITAANIVRGVHPGPAILKVLDFIAGMGSPPVMRCFAHLSAPGADLTGQTLFGADLQHADLSGAVLESASLLTCQLKGANLSGASFIGSIIELTNFANANLENARLSDAKLKLSSLEKANVKGAKFAGTLILDSGLYSKSDVASDLKLRGADVTGIRVLREEPSAGEGSFM